MRMFLFYFSLLVNGALGVMHKSQSVSVMEGDSVTLYADPTEIQKADLILWTFGPDGTRIAQFNRMDHKISLYKEILDGKFRDRLTLDSKTGSLTITNTKTTDSGLYKLELIGKKDIPSMKFSIIVYAYLPVPVLTSYSSQCFLSHHSCLLVCSVVNASAVSLSWYKGNSVLSSISVSDLSISLSLPLEVEYQEKNTYSCVINNTISNQTTHLDINTLCQPCSAGLSTTFIGVICAAAPVSVLILIFCCFHYCKRRWKKIREKQHSQEDIPLTDFRPNGSVDQQDNGMFVGDEITSVSVMVGHSVTLQTGIPEIQKNELIRWTFAEYREIGRSPFVVIAEYNKSNNQQNRFNERILEELELNHRTGSLTITGITQRHYGYYKLLMSSEGQRISKTFSVVAKPSRKERRKTCPL
ncbi:uncharacterized protein isoform X8 [Danio rerio]|uniref:Uncharacterized protein isoform X8 n=1 Tax=Danio rerio TaxID=7955 RepID=A0AC58IFZ6_DANRE